MAAFKAATVVMVIALLCAVLAPTAMGICEDTVRSILPHCIKFCDPTTFDCGKCNSKSFCLAKAELAAVKCMLDCGGLHAKCHTACIAAEVDCMNGCNTAGTTFQACVALCSPPSSVCKDKCDT